MKLVSIIKGTTVRAARLSKPLGYLPDLIDAVVEQYKFKEYPTDISKLIPHGNLNAESPAIFRHGKLTEDSRSLFIDELQVFQNGTIVSTPSNTTDADFITEKVFRWAGKRFELGFEPIKPLGHASQMEVRFERPLPDLFPPLKEIGIAINESLDPFWESIPPYELINLHFGVDQTKAPRISSEMFKIERRADMPFEQVLYFCEAALTTDNHLTILEQFERICLEHFAR